MKFHILTLGIVSSMCVTPLTDAALTSSAGDPPSSILEELASKDSRRISEACKLAIEYPTPSMVSALAQLLSIEERSNLKTRMYFDVGYLEPCVYAMAALSQIVPDPATTFETTFQRKRSIGFYIHYLDLWNEWWEENHVYYETGPSGLPARPADSLLNLTIEERAAREDVIKAKSRAILEDFRTALAHDNALNIDEWAVQYLEDRKAERAAARAAAKESGSVAEPTELPSEGKSPPPATSGSEGAAIKSEGWQWWLGLGAVFAVGFVVAFLRQRRGGADSD
jgi:hypothetical protein